MGFRKTLFYAFTLFLTVTSFGYADLETLDDSRDISWNEAYRCRPQNFFSSETLYDNISKSKFTTPENDGQKIGFSTFTTIFSYYSFFNCTDAIGVGIGYSQQKFDWNSNPYFNQEEFNNLVIDIGGFSARYPCWLFKGLLRTRINLDDFNTRNYRLFTGTLWGRYEICHNNYFHMGFIVEWGMRRGKVWPIIGFESQLTACTKLNLIYPLDMSLRYSFYKQWFVGVAANFFYYRNRLKKDENISRGFITYRNTGLELQVGYECCPYILADLHIGQAFGNEVKISDHQDKNASHHKFKSAFYFGARLNFKF